MRGDRGEKYVNTKKHIKKKKEIPIFLVINRTLLKSSRQPLTAFEKFSVAVKMWETPCQPTGRKKLKAIRE